MNEKEYWNWFNENSKEISDFLFSDFSDMSIYNELTEKTRSHSELITPELTADENGTNVLILTCEGNPKGIHHVQNLARCAPKIEGWRIQEFRQPGHAGELSLKGLNLRPSDFLFNYYKQGDKHAFDIFIKGFRSSDPRFGELAFLYLDHYLGEYRLMTTVGQITLKKLGMFTKKSELINLFDLQKKVLI